MTHPNPFKLLMHANSIMIMPCLYHLFTTITTQVAICRLTRNVPWCIFQVYLLCRSKNCPKQVSKGLKYIKWTTHLAQKRCLTLTFKHVTWKSIWIIYSLRATPAPSLVLIKWRGQKILSRQHLTDSCKTISPLFQYNKQTFCIILKLDITG